MSKLGVDIPDELDERLRVFVPWGRKGHVIEGLLRLAVEEAEEMKEFKLTSEQSLINKAIKAYHEAHK